MRGAIVVSLMLALAAACSGDPSRLDAPAADRHVGAAFVAPGGGFVPPTRASSGGGTSLSGGTANDLAVWTGASTIGISDVSDDGTTIDLTNGAGKAKVTIATGATTITGGITLSGGGSLAGSLTYNSGSTFTIGSAVHLNSTATLTADANVTLNSSTSGATTVKGVAEFQAHVRATGTSPAISGCGTGSSITGSDTAFRITGGSSGVACTITFHTAYTTTAPICIVSPEGSTTLPNCTISTTAISCGSTIANTVKYDWHCWAPN